MYPKDLNAHFRYVLLSWYSFCFCENMTIEKELKIFLGILQTDLKVLKK